MSEHKLGRTERERRQKCRLFAEQRGLCFYCNKHMMLTFQHLKQQPENLATLEHMDSKWSQERGKHPGEQRHVLACRKCNWTRGRLEEAAQSKEVLKARSMGIKTENMGKVDSQPEVSTV